MGHRIIIVLYLMLQVVVSLRRLQAIKTIKTRGRLIVSMSGVGGLARPVLAPNAKNQVIVLAGCTAVGKSAVARHVCETLGNCEVILADSVQIYKHLDIGSNKPSVAEMSETVHHMVNICDPHDAYSCGDFVKQAVPLIYDVLNRGKVPVVVGGSTMWIQWLVHGMPDAPKADPSIVRQAEALLKEASDAGDWDAGVEVLRQLDPVRVATLGRNDWYRLHRYLEVALSLRSKPSSGVGGGDGSEAVAASSGEGVDGTGGGPSQVTGERVKLLSELDVRCFFLSESREQLYRCIDSRCQEMLKTGLVNEVANLLLEERLTPAAVPARAIGYRQTIEYLLSITEDVSNKGSRGGKRNEAVTSDVASFVSYAQGFATATRNYAKRQLGWYRNDKSFLWIKIRRLDPDSNELSGGGGDSDSITGSIAPYVKVSQEITHWCGVSQSSYNQAIKHQLHRATAVAAIRARVHQGHRMNLRPNQHDWIALAALVHAGELRPPQRHPNPGEQAQSWIAGFDASTAAERAHAPFGSFDPDAEADAKADADSDSKAESTGIVQQVSSASASASASAATASKAAPSFPIELPYLQWSAHDALIRAPEGKANPSAKALRAYQSRFDTTRLASLAEGPELDAVIRSADEAGRALALRHPTLLTEFRQAWDIGGPEQTK